MIGAKTARAPFLRPLLVEVVIGWKPQRLHSSLSLGVHTDAKDPGRSSRDAMIEVNVRTAGLAIVYSLRRKRLSGTDAPCLDVALTRYL